MQKCQECGYENNDSSKFCSCCGHEFKKNVNHNCANCGSVLTPTALFCEHCGQRVAQDNHIDEPVIVAAPAPTKATISPKTNLAISIVAIVVIFGGFALIVLGLFLNWIAISKSTQSPFYSDYISYSTNAYMFVIEDILEINIGKSSIGEIFYPVNQIISSFAGADLTSIPLETILVIACLTVPFLFGGIAQILILLLVIAGAISSLILILTKKNFIKSASTIAIVILFLAILSSIIIGSIGIGLIVTLISSAIMVFSLKVFELILDPHKPPVKTLIPNFIAAGALLISTFLFFGLSRYILSESGVTLNFGGLGKYLILTLASVGAETSNLSFMVNLIIFSFVIIFLSIYLISKLNNLFKNKLKTHHIIGWFLLVSLIIFTISNLIDGYKLINIISGDDYTSVPITYGTTVYVGVFLLISLICGCIRKKTPQINASLNTNF